jgi:hypothetical protein
MRHKVTLYLSEDLLQQYKRAAVRQGVSLSACLTLHLSTLPSQFDALQQWLAGRFDELQNSNGAVMEKALQAMTAKSGDGLLAKAGLDRLPSDLLLTALSMMGRELADLSPEAREQMAAQGRELLARTNGAGK